jgi:hypothetical protein
MAVAVHAYGDQTIESNLPEELYVLTRHSSVDLIARLAQVSGLGKMA